MILWFILSHKSNHSKFKKIEIVSSTFSDHKAMRLDNNCKNVPLISLMSLKRSLVFPILLFSSISFHWSLRKPFLSLLGILWNSAFKLVCLSFSPLPFASLLFTAILTMQNIQGQEILRVIPKSMLKKQTIISTLGSEISKTRKVWNGQEKWRSRAQTKMREEKSRRSKELEVDQVRKLWSNKKHF